MAKEEKDKLLDHDADGIQEFDNNLPKWWLYGFYVTIALSVVYMFYYHVYSGPSWNVLWFWERGSTSEYTAEVASAKAMYANAPKKGPIKAVLLTDAASLEKGKDIFENKNLCVTCHRADLGGQVGPNLTDSLWINGCSLEEIMTNITTGFPDKGMIPYGSGTKLSDEELMQVASYVISKRGTNPVDAKPVDPARELPCQ